ncbi:helix-turn-helix domain-containing protein [Silvanigrella aquatica]|uniref:HTH cro/C1-type domain-containing protein n=1 Tax=Silvanigrella aquatica TaxID=1915309 RepID=A0A1L4D424_9BACT|nr:helix-turn-helix transcriptional regulator [Silvanigrella aquatica]APJ04951.1 hypothetical protein AXG55_14025 [Silvanigrella aquatica]
MNTLSKRKNPFEVLGLSDGEMSLNKIEIAYRNTRKNLDEQMTLGNAYHITYEEIEKAFQELITYLDEDPARDSEEVVISSSFLPKFNSNKSRNKPKKETNIVYFYQEKEAFKEQPKPTIIKENIKRPIDSIMNMKTPNSKRVTALMAKKPDKIKELEKYISENEKISGGLLKILRDKMHVSIEEMSNKIKVSRLYLDAIENDCFDKLPAEVYAKGFFNSYLNYLGLDRKDLVEALMDVYRAQKRLIKNS